MRTWFVFSFFFSLNQFTLFSSSNLTLFSLFLFALNFINVFQIEKKSLKNLTRGNLVSVTILKLTTAFFFFTFYINIIIIHIWIWSEETSLLDSIIRKKKKLLYWEFFYCVCSKLIGKNNLCSNYKNKWETSFYIYIFFGKSIIIFECYLLLDNQF